MAAQSAYLWVTVRDSLPIGTKSSRACFARDTVSSIAVSISMTYCCRLACVLVLCLLASGLDTHPARAQEVQVPLSPDSTVYTIDAELEQALGLFPDMQGFREAALFRMSETTYELVIIYRQQGQTVRERRTLTGAEVNAFRQQVARQLQATGTRVNVDQPGRPELLVATTFLGSIEGVLLAGAIAPDSGPLIAGLPLLTGAAGFFVPLFATQNRPIPEAPATLAGFGGLQGYAHAGQLSLLLGGSDLEGRAFAGLAAVTGAAEATAGYLLATRRGWSPGMGEMMAYNGLAGNLLGLGVGLTVAGEGMDFDDRDTDARLVAGLSLLGSFSGIYAGYRLGRTGRYTRGDARLYSLAGLLATQLAISGALVADLDDTRAVAGLLTGSGLAGLGAGTTLVRNRDFSTYASNLIALGNYAGALLGAGIATLFDGSSDAITVAQAVGAVTGFGISYHVFADDARRVTSSTPSGVNLRLNVTPALRTVPSTGPLPSTVDRADRIRPRVTLRASF